MTIQWIRLSDIEQHYEDQGPEVDKQISRIQAWIRRTGLYEPLTVRLENKIFKIIDGNKRFFALRCLGHTHARCDVWDCDAETARLFREEAKP